MNSEAGETKKKSAKGKYADLAAKILCVFFSFLLWFYVMIVESPADETVIRDVAVMVAEDDAGMLAKGLSVYADSEVYVDITLSGKRRVLSKITAEDIKVSADLSGIASADRDITVPLIIEVPDGCQFVSSTRYNIQVNTDSIKKSLIPLTAELENMNPSYIYGETPIFSLIRDGENTETVAVGVEGPSGMVNEVAAAVVKIDVSGKERGFTDTYAIELVDERGNAVDEKFLKKDFETVNVTMSVEVEVEFPLSLVFKHGYLSDTASSFKVSPETVTILCAPSDAHRADLISPIEIDERKVLTEDAIRSHSLKATVQLVSPYSQKISPTEVTVSGSIDREINNRKMLVLELQSTGGIDIDCDILDGFLEDVVVCGRTEALSGLKTSDIVAVVDLSEYTEEHIGKRYQKKVTFEIDSEYGDQVFVVGDYTVEIQIKEK
ncbi:MAG: hypothetical protein E7638_05095 [Ruminococcaceae bacterium]|nr:hypothetical protein [Oscillospiraceae bacterium]